MFDGEHGIALHTLQGNRASSCGKGESHGFSCNAVGTWGIFLSYSEDDTSKLVFVRRRQDSCLVTRDISGYFTRLGRAIRMLLKVRQETERPFLVDTVILRFL